MKKTGGKYDDVFEYFTNKYKNEVSDCGKLLGRGAFGEVRDIKYKNKTMAIKVIEKEKEENIDGEKLAMNLRSFNIIKIHKIYTDENFKEYAKIKEKERDKDRDRERKDLSIKDKNYDFIIMEKAVLRDLGKLNEFFHRHNLLKLIDTHLFDEDSGDNLVRFYARQIIGALETLDRNNYIHFDIKPENLLISVNLIIKLSDFSLLREVDDNEKEFKLPGGTPGYMTPEYYVNKYVKSDVARKQDYFALGSTLFLLKYGLPLLKYKKYDDNEMNADRLMDLLSRNINHLKSQVLTDKDFMKFIISLITYDPDDRANFDKIYRNKWLNKHTINDKLNRTIMAFENDEEKLIMELQKTDFLIKKEEYLEKTKDIKNESTSKSNKFHFKKKKKKNDI